MKNIFRISLALPVALLLAGCQGEIPDLPPAEPDAPSAPTEKIGSYDVMMTINPGETRAVSSITGSPAESAFNENRLFFGTYDETGALIHSLLEAGKCNEDPALNVKYYHPIWGPTVSAKLPRGKYEGINFYVGAFSIPEKVTFSSLSLRGLDNADSNVLKWPGTSATNYTWKPSADRNGDEHIPMAGVIKIETSLMGKYNPDINNFTPFRLPDVTMTRAMAKIIIEDVDGIIETATLKTPEKGKLVPYLPATLDPTKAMMPEEPAGGKGRLLDQKLTAPSDTVNGKKRYIFYSYEWSFLNYDAAGKAVIKDVNHADRKIITLTANAASGLKNTSRGTTQISFAPHAAGFPVGVTDLMNADGGAWQGVMRNTVYTFRVTRPSTGGVTVEVTATPWVKHDKEEFDF